MEPQSSVSSRSSSPKAMHPFPMAHQARGNPFTIDYILSGSAVKDAQLEAGKKLQQQQQQQQHASEQSMLDQFNLINQRRAQLVVAAAAVSKQQHQQQDQLTQSLALTAVTRVGEPASLQLQNQKCKMGEQSNLLYFMAYVLLQQQQQQQLQQQLMKPEQKQQQQQQQPLVQRHHRPALPVQSQQQMVGQLARQQAQAQLGEPASRSPIDSLAVLARLTGTTAMADLANSNSFGKNSNKLHANQNFRQHPYQGAERLAYTGVNASSLYPGSANKAAESSNNKLVGRGHQHASNFSEALNQPAVSSPQLMSQAGINYGQQLNLANKYLQLPNSVSSNSSSTTNSSAPISQNSNCNSSSDKLDNLKPAHSYIGLIGMCILSSPEKRMVLNDIYQFILDNYPYYRNRGSGWRNSVRHNLSLNECFQKAGRAANGKGHYWTIHPANMDDFMMGDFRRRRAQRKVRRWNNMDVPSDESDDESVEDTTKPPLPEHFKRSLEMHRRLELSYQKTVESNQIVAAAAAAAAGASLGNSSRAAMGPTSLILNQTASVGHLFHK